jgi:hypothetical protein
MAKRWTLEEKEHLISLKLNNKPLILEGRTEAATKTMVRELIKEGKILNCHKHYKKWTKEEIDELKRLRELKFTTKQIAEKMNRSVRSITKKLENVNHITSERIYTDDELLELVIRYRTQDNLNLNRLPGEISSGPITKRFGSWGKALEAAGLEPNASGMVYNWPTILYLVDFGSFKKVGVTQRTVEARFSGFPEYRILDVVVFEDLYAALETEKEILKNLEKFRVIGEIPNGRYECFKYDCTLLDDLI